jgi:mannose-6-phosphate isomerase-like protein (cupin superfamily)
MKLLLLLAALPLIAADPAGIQVWTAAELESRARALKLNQNQQGAERIADWGNHAAVLERLEGATPGEIHENLADVFVITSGETTLITGGAIVEPAATAPGEIRGKSIAGGASRKLAAGDVVHIPAKTPHQLSVAPGKVSTYLVIKVHTE